MTAMKSSDDILNRASRAVKELKQFISGNLHLDQSDVAARRALIKAASRASFYFFAKSVLGLSRMTHQTHLRWCNDLQDDFWKFDYLMRLKPRNTFKTSIYGEAFILWIWATVSQKVRFFYTSANSALLQEVSAHMKHYLGPDSVYSLVFGVRMALDAKNTEDVINLVGRDYESKGSSLIFRPAGGSTNGLHPHVVIIDDPMDREDRESQAIRDRKKRWMDSLEPLIDEFLVNGNRIRKMMFIATRWHLDDLVAYTLALNDKVENPAQRWSVEVEGVFLADGVTPRYPELMDADWIRDKRTKMDPVFFSCQYLNTPLPEGARIFDSSSFSVFNVRALDTASGVKVCFLDPSQGRKGSDWPAVFWGSWQDETLFILDALKEKMRLGDLLEWISHKNLEHQVDVYAYETNGTTLLDETMWAHGRTVGWTPQIVQIHESRSKEVRITLMQPAVQSGQIRFRDDWATAYPEMIAQLEYFPVHPNDDFPDVIEKGLSYCCQKFPGGGGRSVGASDRPSSLSGSFKTDRMDW